MTNKLLFSITGILLVMNCLLIFHNRTLQHQIEELKPKQIEVGERLPPFVTKDLDGNTVDITLAAKKKMVFLYFQSHCGFCKKQIPYWSQLVSQIDRSKYDIVAITAENNMDDVKKFVNNYEVSAWKVLSIRAEDANIAKLNATPITVVADDNGVVEKAWVGMWRESELDDARKYFAIDFVAQTK